MTKSSRRKNTNEKTVPYNAIVPESVALRADLLILNPLTGKVKYGARSQLIEKLLRRWIAEQTGEGGYEGGTGEGSGCDASVGE